MAEAREVPAEVWEPERASVSDWDSESVAALASEKAMAMGLVRARTLIRAQPESFPSLAVA